jgi:hypothetical protein
VCFTFGANLTDARPELNLRAEACLGRQVAKPNGLCPLSATAPALSEACPEFYRRVERGSLAHSVQKPQKLGVLFVVKLR